MRRWLAIVGASTLVACGSASPSAQSARTASATASSRTTTPSGTPTATSSVMPVGNNRAVDSYPSAPQVSFALLGNGVYGNAFLLSGPDAWYWDGAAWHHMNAHMPDAPHTAPVYDTLLKKSVVLTNGETGMPVNAWAWT